MTRYTLMAVAALAATAGSAGVASAQFQTQPYQISPYQFSPYPQGPYSPPSVMPNIYNPANQPLSPYLNLLRGGNQGVNYYYGVRPGTVGGTGFGIGAPFTAQGGNRMLFFPQLARAPDPDQPREAGVGDVLPPAGHPVVFGNTLGYFPVPGGRGTPRSGLTGVGARRR
jgi:hypothetical protein